MQDHEHGQNGGAQEQSPMSQDAQANDKPDRNRPVETLRDGNISASIWENRTDKGVSYTTTFSRSWRDDSGEWRQSQSYSGSDMLRLGELSRSAYHRTNELRREQSQQHSQEQEPQAQKRMAFEQRRSRGQWDHASRRDR